jgi:hypothetical protein
MQVGFSSCTAVTLYGKRFSFSQTALCAAASPIPFCCANLRNDFYGLRSIVRNVHQLLIVKLDGLPLRSASNTQPVSRNFSLSLRNALRWGTDISGNFSANCSCTKSVYLLPSRKTYSTRKTRSSIERTIVSKNWIKQLNTTDIALKPPFNNWIQWNNSTLQRRLRYWQPNLRSVAYVHSDFPNVLYYCRHIWK